MPLLERTKGIVKSAFAAPGGRPGPQIHMESTRVDPAQPLLIGGVKRITMVEDSVTRGSTFLGMYPHIVEAFPTMEVRCFARVRTESYREIVDSYASVEGRISLSFGNLVRSP